MCCDDQKMALSITHQHTHTHTHTHTHLMRGKVSREMVHFSFHFFLHKEKHVSRTSDTLTNKASVYGNSYYAQTSGNCIFVQCAHVKHTYTDQKSVT